MKKKLNETDIENELRGASLFFQRSATTEDKEVSEPKPRRRGTRPSKLAAPAATIVAEVEAPAESKVGLADTASSMASSTPDLDHPIEIIRKNVKRLGKEATFCRFTQEEKNALGDIIYTYKRSGIRTSENEVVRIAINWLLENHRSDGQNSVLAQVLDKLNS
jgi:hypothetical protein